MLKNIDETLDYIYSLINLEGNIGRTTNFKKSYSLDNILHILKYFDNLHKNKKIIHIAGTKGKGSTSHFISLMLNEAGFSTLTFTSPHLLKTNERIQYNLKSIPDKDLIEITNYAKDIIDKNKLAPTAFELFFILSLIYGERKKVDYYVIEAGLGGRIDCTNVVDSMISVITSIGFDHVDILGNTIKAISYEKGGIIKENSRVIVANQTYNCKKYFKRIAKNKNSKFIYSPDIAKSKNIKYADKGVSFNIKINDNILKNITLTTMGKHQVNNFITALTVINEIYPDIIKILNSNKTLNVSLIGKMQVVKYTNTLIVDVAHNKESALTLKQTIRKHFRREKDWVILLGVAAEKDYKQVIKSLKGITNKVIVTSTDKYKKSDPAKVYNYAKTVFKQAETLTDQTSAFQYALSLNKPLIVTGSFYTAGPFLEYFNNKK